MTISLTHAYVSAKADGSDPTLIQPSHWNAEHAIQMATSRLLGRVTAGDGAAEELTADQLWTFLGIVAGTRMPFHQTAAPTGFTKDTSINDKTLRIVSGTVGSGGTKAFTTLFGASKAVSGTAITQAQLPNVNLAGSGTTNTTGAHTHTYERADSGGSVGGSGSQSRWNGYDTQNTGSAGDHSHTVTVTVPLGGSGATHNHTIDLDVQYVDLIIASKS